MDANVVPPTTRAAAAVVGTAVEGASGPAAIAVGIAARGALASAAAATTEEVVSAHARRNATGRRSPGWGVSGIALSSKELRNGEFVWSRNFCG